MKIIINLYYFQFTCNLNLQDIRKFHSWEFQCIEHHLWQTTEDYLNENHIIWKHTNSESPPHPEGEVTVMPEAKEDQNNIVNACFIMSYYTQM